jgi:hypothetical protein
MILSRTARVGARFLCVEIFMYVFRLVALTILLIISVMTLGYTQGRAFIAKQFAPGATRPVDGRKIAQVIPIADFEQLIDDTIYIWLLWLAIATFNYFKVPEDQDVTLVCAGDTLLFSKAGLPPITATSGIELMEEIDAWLDALLLIHFRINQT